MPDDKPPRGNTPNTRQPVPDISERTSEIPHWKDTQGLEAMRAQKREQALADKAQGSQPAEAQEKRGVADLSDEELDKALQAGLAVKNAQGRENLDSAAPDAAAPDLSSAEPSPVPEPAPTPEQETPEME